MMGSEFSDITIKQSTCMYADGVCSDLPDLHALVVCETVSDVTAS